jgi:hypothetical protein
VAQTGVPAEVRRFIAAEIESVGQLEVLLLLRGAPDKTWTADEVERALVMQAGSATSWLEQMAGGAFVARQGPARTATRLRARRSSRRSTGSPRATRSTASP